MLHCTDPPERRGGGGEGGSGGSTHRAAADVALPELPEPVRVHARVVHLAQRDVHEVVAVHEVPVERLSVLELYQLRSIEEEETEERPQSQ